jgi:hypothetical protein
MHLPGTVSDIVSSPLPLVDLPARARQALASSPVFGLRELSIDQRDGALLIDGVVSSYYHKQLAQELVLAIAGDSPVVNAVQVEWQLSRSGAERRS